MTEKHDTKTHFLENGPYERRCVALKKKLDDAFAAIYDKSLGESSSVADLMTIVYHYMFKKVPHRINTWHYPSYMKERIKTSKFGDKCVDGSEKKNDKWEDIIDENTFLNLMKYYRENDIAYFLWRYDFQPILITENEEIIFVFGNMMFYAQYDELPQYVMDCLVFCDENTARYYYLAYGKNGYEAIDLDIREIDVDIEMNYNDDLPYDEIVDALESEEAGLIILRGEPGTAKSTLIRHLITTLDMDFIYLDHSCFDSMTDSSFIQTLADYENSILILEDCEDMVKDRTADGTNNKIAALLNLSSGLLADSFKFKIICTFNAPIAKVDKALLRKGRLKVDYEFKKLSPQKTAALAAKLGKEIKPGDSMTAGDIYNNDVTVEFGAREKKKIGFV